MIQGSFNFDNTALPQYMYIGNLQLDYTNMRAFGAMRVDFQVDRVIRSVEKIVL
jgi:hypothetical protein